MAPRRTDKAGNGHLTNQASNWPRTPSGCLSTKAKHIGRLIDDLPDAALLVWFSQLEQLRSNFGDKLFTAINPQTGRLHGSFQLAKAKSGRFASSNPNMQNIPKSNSIPLVLVAAPSKQLVVADYSQLELRVMAFIANDQVMTLTRAGGTDHIWQRVRKSNLGHALAARHTPAPSPTACYPARSPARRRRPLQPRRVKGFNGFKGRAGPTP